MFNADQALMEKWAPVLNHESAPIIESQEKKAITARLLENTEVALREEAAQGTYSLAEGSNQASADYADPVLISLVRRAMPNLIAYDVAGVQPMSGPTGLIFAMKSRYEDTSPTTAITTADTEALFDEADTDFSGAGTHKAGGVGQVNLSTAALGDICQVVSTAGSTGANWTAAGASTGDAVPAAGTVFTATASTTGTGQIIILGQTGEGQSTANGEDGTIAEAGFTVEKISVEAKTRALKAEYTMELAQDLKAMHGLDAEAELANILSAEVLAEINREVIRKINTSAKVGTSSTIDGYLNLDTDADVGDGRWQAERFQALGFRLEQEANSIAKDTRRGKGNYIIASSSVAAALSAAGSLAYGAAQTAGSLAVDNAGNTFAGTLKNGMKVYVDPYATIDYATVGYKGANTYDAGIFYCPYVPLTMMKAVGENTFQPKVGFKTRYGLVANPFANATGAITVGTNPYFRRLVVAGV